MKKFILGLAVIAVALLLQADLVQAQEGPARRIRRVFAPGQYTVTTWHGHYYNPVYGMPIAIVVPPNANTMRSQGWGVASSQMMPLRSQYGTAYPGTVTGSLTRFQSRGAFPSNTRQFGYYYVRGPW